MSRLFQRRAVTDAAQAPLGARGRGLVALCALLALAGCVTPLTPGALIGRLAEATTLRPYPFIAFGTVTYTTPANGGTGTVALAVEGEKFRLEVTDPTGLTRLAVAGDRRRLIQLDPTNGKRSETALGVDGVVPLGDGGIGLPTGLLQTSVTAALPPTGPMTAAFPHGSLACYASISPTLTFCVGDALEEVWFPGEREQRIVMTLGPEIDEAPSHRRWVKISDRQQGVNVEIRWRSVTLGVDRPEGFFTFDDQGEW